MRSTLSADRLRHCSGEGSLRARGVYCTRQLGDDPSRSSTGCRFYVYLGKACEAWLDYHDLDVALAESPGEPVFDRAITTNAACEEVVRPGD